MKALAHPLPAQARIFLARYSRQQGQAAVRQAVPKSLHCCLPDGQHVEGVHDQRMNQDINQGDASNGRRFAGEALRQSRQRYPHSKAARFWARQSRWAVSLRCCNRARDERCVRPAVHGIRGPGRWFRQHQLELPAAHECQTGPGQCAESPGSRHAAPVLGGEAARRPCRQIAQQLLALRHSVLDQPGLRPDRAGGLRRAQRAARVAAHDRCRHGAAVRLRAVPCASGSIWSRCKDPDFRPIW